MARHYPNSTAFFLLVPVVGVLACGGEDLTTPPTAGSVEVTTSTTGAEPDPDGYTVQLDAGSAQVIGSAAVLQISDISVGSHAIQLADVAANCTVAGDNPRTVAVTAGEATAVTFAVVCSAVPTTGNLDVSSSTIGPSTDADSYTITLDGTDRGPLGLSAVVSLTGLTPGTHVLGLSGVPANCQVSEENPRSVTVAAGASTAVAFSVTCTAPPLEAGTIRVTTVTTGTDQDSDGYVFAVDGGSSQPIGINSAATVASVAAGEHSVQLGGVTSSCAVEGTNPRAVTVSRGTMAELSFVVTCTTSTAGTPSASKSGIEASPSTMNLQGISTVTVTVRDGNGRSLSGVSVTLSSSGTGNSISPASQPSGTDGRATFTFTSEVAETKTITARAGLVELSQKATVTVEKVASTIDITSDDPEPSVVNQKIRVTVFVTAGNQAPSGAVTVTVSNGPETCSATLENGNAFCDIVLLTSGTGADNQRVITAAYSGDDRCTSDTDTEGHRVDPSIFELVSVRDHIPGSFTVPRALYADRDRIYLGSAQGTLFVLARDRAADFPIIQTIDLGVPITAVRGDADRLYASTPDGLWVFAKGTSLSVVATRVLSTYLGTVEVLGDKIYVTVGQAELEVDSDHLYLARLSAENEVALEVDKTTLEVTRTYGETFVEGQTVVYNRVTGAIAATIPYPPVQLGPPGQPRLYLNGSSLMETNPGCCGLGITIVKAPEFVESEFISEPNANAVVAVDNGFWAGMETGTVGFFDQQNHLVQRLDLPAITGHIGGEDIEIRSLWADGFDDLVFAASTWGNDASRSPTLPAFFVLRLK
jgi:hypothetical protein